MTFRASKSTVLAVASPPRLFRQGVHSVSMGHERPSSVRDVCFRVTSRFLSHRTTSAQLSQNKTTATGRTRTCSVNATRGATQARRSTASAARTEITCQECEHIVTVRSPEEPTRRCGCQSRDHLPRARSRFEFDFRQCDFFEGFEFLVCSKFNHMQRDRTCACAVACLHPRKFHVECCGVLGHSR